MNFSKIKIVENYEYLLIKTFYKIKNLVKKYSELFKEFYFTNNTLFDIIYKFYHHEDNPPENEQIVVKQYIIKHHIIITLYLNIDAYLYYC